MKFSPFLILLTAFAAGASAAPITTSATADMRVFYSPPQPPLIQHSSYQGTSYASAGVTNYQEIGAFAWATATGTTFDVHVGGSNWDHSCRCSAYVASAAELTLNDGLLVPVSATRWSVDLAVGADGNRISAVEMRVGNGYAIWGYPVWLGLPVRTTITASGGDVGGGPWARAIPIYIHVWTNTGDNGIVHGGAVGNIHVQVQQVRVYNDYVSSDPLTGFSYISGSGMVYPVLGGTYAPEPGSAAFLITGGLLLLASHRRMRR